MKFVILLAVAAVARAQDTQDAASRAHLARDYLSVGIPVVTPAGYIADTPEVAAAKASHLAALDAAYAAPASSYAVYQYAPAAPYYPYYGTAVADAASSAAPVAYYSYPVAHAPYYRGYLAAPATRPTTASDVAKTVVTPEGFIADTPEVHQAKLAHPLAHLNVIQGFV